MVAAGHRSMTRQVFMHQVAGSSACSPRGGQPGPGDHRGARAGRFYTAVFGLARVGVERPPTARRRWRWRATTIERVAEHVFSGQTMARRTMAGLISDPEPPWLRNRAWPIAAPTRCPSLSWLAPGWGGGARARRRASTLRSGAAETA